MLIILTKYFRLTNYTWMWTEGFYLYRLLSNTFEEQQRLPIIVGVAWGNFVFISFPQKISYIKVL